MLSKSADEAFLLLLFQCNRLLECPTGLLTSRVSLGGLKNQLTQVVYHASKILRQKKSQPQDLFVQFISIKAIQIYNDPIHPLNPAFQPLPSGRGLTGPLDRKNNESFVSSSVVILNKNLWVLMYIICECVFTQLLLYLLMNGSNANFRYYICLLRVF